MFRFQGVWFTDSPTLVSHVFVESLNNCKGTTQRKLQTRKAVCVCVFVYTHNYMGKKEVKILFIKKGSSHYDYR